MECRLEGLDLLHQVGDQLGAGADWHCRNVVDGLLRVQPAALAPDGRQGIDDVSLDSQQPEFEDLKQAAGACTDDQCVCLNDHMLVDADSGSRSLVSSGCRTGLVGGREILRDRARREQATPAAARTAGARRRSAQSSLNSTTSHRAVFSCRACCRRASTRLRAFQSTTSATRSRIDLVDHHGARRRT